jgi:signal transduction histidine kinase
MDGDVDWIVGATRDVNQQKRREQELKRRNERLDEFTSIISHELRNPLNVVDGKLELARDDCESDHLADATEAVGRCQALIEDLLTLARKDSHIEQTTTVALADIAEQSWQFPTTKPADLKIETQQHIQADSNRLQQLFENLYRNAVEHGGEDVTITVGDLSDEDGFYVADDGPGIPKTERTAVFEAGYSTREKGTGFGLRIVKQIANAHMWEVALTESKDGGARFEITGVEHITS